MSMTQLVFLKKADIPTKSKIEEKINELGYEFKILNDFEILYGQEGINCVINGSETFFELYFEKPSEIIDDLEWIKSDITDEDIVFSFVWGNDFAAGASVGLISVVLIDECNAHVYYLDDEMKYSREMLLSETPQFLNELEKEEKNKRQRLEKSHLEIKQTEKKKGFIEKIKQLFS
ncbi:hypothetical protein IRZ71_13140 [Flavobacterium sp. ANB]|uniref:hypothetical protein n=1 Tax=unclassified Flavobacterium TaxID=196869 RepID=UPI0012B85A0E|nr:MULTISPECIES: hypothetical protein [unclassified Flavobacterium]MBF4517303.1 hypothetical protein [Flavobacterium sp. ANB]MTD70680.1 hypothetical protein [Flavobacterium sp. LC2016-13]